MKKAENYVLNPGLNASSILPINFTTEQNSLAELWNSHRISVKWIATLRKHDNSLVSLAIIAFFKAFKEVNR